MRCLKAVSVEMIGSAESTKGGQIKYTLISSVDR